MSYSFSSVAPTKAEAMTKATEEIQKVVEQQPAHKAEQALVLAQIQSFLDLVGDPPEGYDMYVYVNGSVSWRDSETKLTGVTANISVQHYYKQPA